MEVFDTRMILVVVGVLTLATNIVTEVLKKLFWNLIPTNILTVIVAESLTLISGFSYAQIAGSGILWHHIAAAVVAGLFVSYAAMFGFDKFKDAVNKAGDLHAGQS